MTEYFLLTSLSHLGHRLVVPTMTPCGPFLN